MHANLNSEELMNRWRRQFGSRRPYQRRRPLAAIGFLQRAKDRAEPLVELQRLVAVVLFDEEIGRKTPALRLAGYGAGQVPHGVQWGGQENGKFYRDFRLEPEPGGWGLRVDSMNVELMQLALQLSSALYRVDRFSPKSAPPQPRLPRLWAGFSPAEVGEVRAIGPEFSALCEKFNLPADAMLEKFRREHKGLVCLPMDWVDSSLARSLAIFADMSETPRTQVFQLPEFPASLQGFQGATAFDFYHSTLRRQFEARLAKSLRPQGHVDRSGSRSDSGEGLMCQASQVEIPTAQVEVAS